MGKLNILNINRMAILLLFSGLLTACASGHCRGQKINPDKKIFVYKPDGSLQCEAKSGVSLEKMAEEFGEIKIFSKENKSDGKMHIMLCGSPSGKVNVYEIYEHDFEKIKNAGFRQLEK